MKRRELLTLSGAAVVAPSAFLNGKSPDPIVMPYKCIVVWESVRVYCPYVPLQFDNNFDGNKENQVTFETRYGIKENPYAT